MSGFAFYTVDSAEPFKSPQSPEYGNSVHVLWDMRKLGLSGVVCYGHIR